MGLEYVDIFTITGLIHDAADGTMRALDHLVRQGKALYVGISNYPLAQAREAVKILNDLGTPCIIHQPRYSMFERGVEEGLLDFLQTEGIGSIAFPLATYRPLSQRPAGKSLPSAEDLTAIGSIAFSTAISGRLARRQQQSFSAAGATDSCPIRKNSSA